MGFARRRKDTKRSASWRLRPLPPQATMKGTGASRARSAAYRVAQTPSCLCVFLMRAGAGRLCDQLVERREPTARFGPVAFGMRLNLVEGDGNLLAAVASGPGLHGLSRSEERRVGKGWVSPCRYRGLPSH